MTWVSIATNTPSASPFTFTNPPGPTYPIRSYRLVTP
jgi:hypothetical protein